MPPTYVDKMLETMMMQLLSPDQNAANTVCWNCCKEKKNKSQSCCKCGKNSKNKNKKRRRKLKKSCLKTVICLSKVAKDSGECEDCPSDACSKNVDEDGDERYCSKCGQLLPGMLPDDHEPAHHYDPTVQHVQRFQEPRNDIGVQVNVEPKEPLSVRIKVCPCPFNNPRSQDEKLCNSVSLPELSTTNPRLVDDATSGNLVSSRAPNTGFTDNHYDQSCQSHPYLKGHNETTPEWPVDIASMKKLALKIAKARLVEDSACWEREHTLRCLQQCTGYQTDQEPTDERLVVDPVESVNTVEASGGQRHSSIPFEEEHGDLRPPEKPHMPRKTYPTNTSHNYTLDTERTNGTPGTSNFGMPFIPMQDRSIGCCASTNVYCYSPENGPTPFSDYCKHECTCMNTGQFQPYQLNEAYPGYPYQTVHQQHECEKENSFIPDPYYDSYGRRARSPCR